MDLKILFFTVFMVWQQEGISKEGAYTEEVFQGTLEKNHNQEKGKRTMKTYTMLCRRAAALLPDEQDVAFYEEHGWYISKKVIPDDVIDEAIAGSQRYYRGERDMPLPVSGGYSDWKPGDGDTIRNNEYTSLQSRQLRQLALNPLLGRSRPGWHGPGSFGCWTIN